METGWERRTAPLRLSSVFLAVEEMLSPSAASWGKKVRDGGTTEELPRIHEALQSSSVRCCQKWQRAGPQL